MRLYITIVGLVILMVGLGAFTLHLLSGTTKDITSNFDHIYDLINNQDWKAAEEQITRSEKLWSKHKNWWAVVIDHQEIDNIDGSFSKIGEYIKSHDKALSSGELVVLKQILEHIPEKETVNLKNIL